MMTVLMSKIGAYLFPLLSLVLAAFGVYHIGKQKESAKRDREEIQKEAAREVAEAKEEVKIVKEKAHVQEAVNTMRVDDVRNRLFDNWARD